LKTLRFFSPGGGDGARKTVEEPGDALVRGRFCRTAIFLPPIRLPSLRDESLFVVATGGVASLNHRLRSWDAFGI